MKYDIVALYVCIDDFNKIYEEWEQKKLIGATKNRKREGKLSMSEKLFRKRFCIETIFGFLKNSMNLEHTRHRSSINFLINLIAALTTYSLTKGKTKKLFISTSLIYS